MPIRLDALSRWLSDEVGLGEFTIAPASDDASFRRYFRVSRDNGSQLIAMDAPPEQEDCRPFVRIARQWQLIGLHVPKIHAESVEQGFLLLEDLGSSHYLDRLDADSVDRLYGDALAALAIIQSVAPLQDLPAYDAPLLRQEMALFSDWLLGQQLGLSLSAQEQQMLARCCDLLVDNALEQPQVCVHRDYHSRNLLVTASPSPGVIDFQDAVVGPVTYDLVSLLRDCYIQWPRAQVEGWAMGYFQLACQSGVLQPEHEGAFMRWFDLMGVQRQLKASGIFARLNLRDGKAGYLADIPRTLGYIVEVTRDYPELAALGGFIASRVLPKL